MVVKRAVAAVAAILVREGLDYPQSKAVFKAARQRAGLQPLPIAAVCRPPHR